MLGKSAFWGWESSLGSGTRSRPSTAKFGGAKVEVKFVYAVLDLECIAAVVTQLCVPKCTPRDVILSCDRVKERVSAP